MKKWSAETEIEQLLDAVIVHDPKTIEELELTSPKLVQQIREHWLVKE